MSTGPRCLTSSPSAASRATIRWTSWTRSMRCLSWMALGPPSMAVAALMLNEPLPGTLLCPGLFLTALHWPGPSALGPEPQVLGSNPGLTMRPWASTGLPGPQFSCLYNGSKTSSLASPRLCHLSSESTGVTDEQWALLCTPDHILASPPQPLLLLRQSGCFPLGPIPARPDLALFPLPGPSCKEKVGHLNEQRVGLRNSH